MERVGRAVGRRPVGPPLATLGGVGNDGQETTIELAAVREAVLRWAANHRRPVAVRDRRDPYAVLVAEFMAQQTQIERVAEAWRAFLAAFPSPKALARARPADVLRAWGNLGYNRRALALLRAARAIVADHAGVVPADPATLERLPGVGPYTARAVAAIAYGRPVGPVDTNVRRVLGRLVAVEGRAPRSSVQVLADALAAGVPDPAAWTYALMDLGATVCRPEPLCDACPLVHSCAYATGRRAGPAGRSEASGGIRSFMVPRGARPRGKGEGSRAPRAERRSSRLGSSRPAPPPPGSPPPGTNEGWSPVGRVSPDRLPFPATRRWLRGRIMERLRAAPGEEWVRIEGSIGIHAPAAVEAVLAALEQEGLLERDPTDPTRARLPVA